MTQKKVLHKGVENRVIGIWDDLYRGLPGPVKSFLSVIIVSTTLMLQKWSAVFHNPASARRWA